MAIDIGVPSEGIDVYWSFLKLYALLRVLKQRTDVERGVLRPTAAHDHAVITISRWPHDVGSDYGPWWIDPCNALLERISSPWRVSTIFHDKPANHLEVSFRRASIADLAEKSQVTLLPAVVDIVEDVIVSKRYAFLPMGI